MTVYAQHSIANLTFQLAIVPVKKNEPFDGSFASAKADPGDIDLIVVYPADFNFTAQINPAEYNMIDRRRVRRVYGFDVAPVALRSPDLQFWTEFFGRDNRGDVPRKGLLRVIL